MADFAPNFTARYRFRYTSLSKSHSMLWRLKSPVTDPAPLVDKIGLFLEDLAPVLWNDFTITTAEFAPANSDVFVPAASPTFGGGDNVLTGSFPSDAATAISFVGRSLAGQKARMFLYGTNLAAVYRSTLGNDFRITASESAAIAAAIVRLNETAPVIAANDDNSTVWYEYVNVKPNDAWVRKLRRG